MKPTAEAFSLQGDKYLGTPYSEMDCQALVEACLRDVGITLNLKGSNAWYRRMTWTGTPEECARRFGRIPVGAFLYIWADDGGEIQRGYHDGLGNASHIGIYCARRDGALNSSSSRGCVCWSKFSGKTISGGWNRVGLWDQLSYGNEIDAALQGGEKMSTTAMIRSQNGKGANLRAKDSSKSFLIATIPDGEEVDIVKAGSRWTHVTWRTLAGYVLTSLLSGEQIEQPDADHDPGGPQDDATPIDEDDQMVTIRITRAQAFLLYNALAQALEMPVG